MRKLMMGVVAVGVTVGLTACGGSSNQEAAPSGGASPASGAAGSVSEQCAKVREYAMGLRYQQQSAEVKALQRQAYNLATQRLDEAVAKRGAAKPLAVITDLDETAIDNTPLLVRDVQNCHDYTAWDTWVDWENTGNPDAIPGAKEFFEHAASKGVTVFYISDRNQENLTPTIATLQKLGFPGVDPAHVMLVGPDGNPTKAQRFAKVEADHTVVMKLGDSMPDFDGAFKSADLPKQRDLVAANAAKFGTEWIVLPDSAYGSWRKAEATPWKP